MTLTDLDGLPPLAPRAFAGTFGLLHRPPGPSSGTGVVLVEPIGYDGFVLRRPLRILADRLAAQGHAVLRYDQPGFGDSRDAPGEPAGLSRLDEALAAACADLAASTGLARIALVGIGLGAVLAARWAVAHPDRAAALALLAPVTSGRLFLRELQLKSSVIAELTSCPAEPIAGARLVVAGLPVPDALAEDLRGLRFAAGDLPSGCPLLVLTRPGAAAEETFAAEAAQLHAAEAGPFEGHDAALVDPTLAVPPLAAFGRIERFLGASLPSGEAAGGTVAIARVEPAPGLPPPARLDGSGLRESLHLFGPGATLAGVWCEPSGRDVAARAPRPVLLVGAGGNPRAGWARGTVALARSLAREHGVASLRFDMADLGDSCTRSDTPPVVFYSPSQTADLSAALDLCDRLGAGGGAVVTGTCSGAYVALNGAIADPRVAHVVPVNLQRFLWDPRDDVEAILRLGNIPTLRYGRNLLDRGKLAKLLRGKVPVPAILRELLRRALRATEARLAPWLGALSVSGALHARIRDGLDGLAARAVPVDLVYSVGDPGLSHLERLFGQDGRRLARWPNLSVLRIEGADHNLTRETDRGPVLERLAAAAWQDRQGSAVGEPGRAGDEQRPPAGSAPAPASGGTPRRAHARGEVVE